MKELFVINGDTLLCPPFYNFGIMLSENTELKSVELKLRSAGFSAALLLPYPVDSITSLCPQNIFFDWAVPLTNTAGDKLNNFSKYSKIKAIFHNRLDDDLPANLVYQGMLKASDYNLPYISLPDNSVLHKGGDMHEGHYSFEMGLRGIPTVAEECMIAHNIELARAAKCHLHFLQVSSRRSVELIRQAKASKMKVTSGVSAGHLLYDHSACQNFNEEFKFYPPLRCAEDRKSLVDGLKDGTLDVISSGIISVVNIPKNFSDSPFTSFPSEKIFSSLYQELVLKKYISLERLIQVLCVTPRQILNLKTNSTKIEIKLKGFE